MWRCREDRASWSAVCVLCDGGGVCCSCAVGGRRRIQGSSDGRRRRVRCSGRVWLRVSFRLCSACPLLFVSTSPLEDVSVSWLTGRGLCPRGIHPGEPGWSRTIMKVDRPERRCVRVATRPFPPGSRANCCGLGSFALARFSVSYALSYPDGLLYPLSHDAHRWGSGST